MNQLSRPFCSLALLGVLAGPLHAAPPAAAPAVDRFERTKAHIDDLLKSRLKPAPLPAKLANPFQDVAAASVATDTGPANPTGPDATRVLSNDDEVLAHYAPLLKITGQVQLGGVANLIINSIPYKEGSVIPVQGKDDTTYYLKVVRIAPGELTLGLNDARLILPVKL